MSELSQFLRRPGPDPRGLGSDDQIRKPQLAELSDFQERAAAAGVQKLLIARSFDCDSLDVLLRIVGRHDRLTANPDYTALRALHGVRWACMGSALARQSREAALQLLGMPTHIAHLPEAQPPAASARWPARWLRIAFWRDR